MNIERDWGKHPFSFGKITLANLVRDFVLRRKSEWSSIHHLRDDIVDWCGESMSVSEAIRRACRSKRPNGKHHNHQSKVASIALTGLEQALLTHRRHVEHADSFDELYVLIDRVKPPGIGPVTTYDVTTRIGAYLNLEPTSVYLHAGVRAGVRLLMDRGHMARNWCGDIVPVTKFPASMRTMSADEIEDFLCTYRTVFSRIERTDE